MDRTRLLVTGLLLCGGPWLCAQDVDELVQKSLEAQGGVQALRAKHSMRLSGTVTVQGMNLPLVMLKKRPRFLKTEVTVQSVSYVEAYDGTTGWKVAPFGGSTDPQAMTAEQTVEMQERAEFDSPLLNYKERGHQLELVGKESLDGKDRFKLKLTRANGRTEFLFIDGESFQVIKSIVTRQGPSGNQEVESFFRDFKLVEGVSVPHSIESKADGATLASIAVETVEWNVDLPDEAFKMPAARTTPPPSPLSRDPNAG